MPVPSSRRCHVSSPATLPPSATASARRSSSAPGSSSLGHAPGLMPDGRSAYPRRASLGILSTGTGKPAAVPARKSSVLHSSFAPAPLSPLQPRPSTLQQPHPHPPLMQSTRTPAPIPLATSASTRKEAQAAATLPIPGLGLYPLHVSDLALPPPRK